MSKTALPAPAGFSNLLKDIKARIQQAQTRAVLAVNAELVRLYWDVGQLLDARQSQQGWGAAVIPRLSRELRNELPEIKGFSERNIDRMVAFYRAYPSPADFSPQAVAKLASPNKVPQPPPRLIRPNRRHSPHPKSASPQTDRKRAAPNERQDAHRKRGFMD